MSYIDSKVSMTWHNNGRIRSVFWIKGGKYHGQCKEWWENSSIKSIGEWKRGVEMSNLCWDRLGHVICSRQRLSDSQVLRQNPVRVHIVSYWWNRKKKSEYIVTLDGKISCVGISGLDDEKTLRTIGSKIYRPSSFEWWSDGSLKAVRWCDGEIRLWRRDGSLRKICRASQRHLC